jgi:hypothetical protein
MGTHSGKAALSRDAIMLVSGALLVVAATQWSTLRDSLTGPDLSDFSAIVSAARALSDTPLGPPPNPFGTDDDWICSGPTEIGRIVPASEILKSLGYDS